MFQVIHDSFFCEIDWNSVPSFTFPDATSQLDFRQRPARCRLDQAQQVPGCLPTRSASRPGVLLNYLMCRNRQVRQRFHL